MTDTTTRKTTAVRTAPKALTAARQRQPGSCTPTQCLTIPICDSVKQTNTPTEYSGIRAWVSPPKIHSRPNATAARTTIPHEYARRSPRNENWRGMKPSSARIAASLGNALKLVLAARNRMSAVAAANAGTNHDPGPKTDDATRATTDGPPAALGRTW